MLLPSFNEVKFCYIQLLLQISLTLKTPSLRLTREWIENRLCLINYKFHKFNWIVIFRSHTWLFSSPIDWSDVIDGKALNLNGDRADDVTRKSRRIRTMQTLKRQINKFDDRGFNWKRRCGGGYNKVTTAKHMSKISAKSFHKIQLCQTWASTGGRVILTPVFFNLF